MKTFNIILFFVLMSLSLYAQNTIERSIPTNDIKNINIEFPYASNIILNTWNKKHISIKASINIDDGELNEHFKLKVEENFNSINITSNYGKLFKKKKRFSNFFSNKNKATIITKEAKEEKIVVDGITIKAVYTINVPQDLALDIQSTSANLTIESSGVDINADIVSGDILVKEYQGNMELKTVSGKIDIKVNQSDALEMKTTIGKIFKANKISRLVIGKELVGCFGSRKGEGNNVELTTVSGDIHLSQQSK